MDVLVPGTASQTAIMQPQRYIMAVQRIVHAALKVDVSVVHRLQHDVVNAA